MFIATRYIQKCHKKTLKDVEQLVKEETSTPDTKPLSIFPRPTPVVLPSTTVTTQSPACQDPPTVTRVQGSGLAQALAPNVNSEGTGDIDFERDFGQWFNHPGDVTPPIPQNAGGPGEPPAVEGLGGLTVPSLSLLPKPIPEQHQQPPPQSSPDMFSAEFIASITTQLEDFDSQLFQPEGDINFERDFGQWFNHPDDVTLDMK
ncbi:hypothetical protein V5O48_018152 [Marasmius crinis-equi]|uniref:Uncharacterized protein n=1 Tax=Marasmius crinis-equi TaxID=585013 RepID=A0ABR3ELZ0_9AGAR